MGSKKRQPGVYKKSQGKLKGVEEGSRNLLNPIVFSGTPRGVPPSFYFKIPYSLKTLVHPELFNGIMTGLLVAGYLSERAKGRVICLHTAWVRSNCNYFCLLSFSSPCKTMLYLTVVLILDGYSEIGASVGNNLFN